MSNVHLMHSHTWLHRALTKDATLGPGYELVPSAQEADIVIWPVPPWPDPEAQERLAAGGPRALAHLLPRLFLFSQEDEPVVAAPGVFTGVSQRHPNVDICRGGFYTSLAQDDQPHAERLVVRPGQSPDLLWSFMGSVRTCPAVRRPLIDLDPDRALTIDTDAWNRDLRWQFDGPRRALRDQALEDYAETLQRSAFVVCPRGVGASSVRLFETMSIARCPVIVADDWLAPHGVDWESCSIRVRERDIASIPAILRERESEAAALGRRAHEAWAAQFSPASILDFLVRQCLDLQRSIPPRRRMTAPPRIALGRPTLRKVRAVATHRVRRPTTAAR